MRPVPSLVRNINIERLHVYTRHPRALSLSLSFCQLHFHFLRNETRYTRIYRDVNNVRTQRLLVELIRKEIWIQCKSYTNIMFRIQYINSIIGDANKSNAINLDSILTRARGECRQRGFQPDLIGRPDSRLFSLPPSHPTPPLSLSFTQCATEM